MDDLLGIATTSYALTAMAYAVFCLQLWRNRNISSSSRLLVFAVMGTTVWAATATAALLVKSDLLWAIYILCDVARLSLWLLFIASMLQGFGQLTIGSNSLRLLRTWIALLVVFSLSGFFGDGSASHARVSLMATLGFAITGMVMTEQLYRSAPEAARWSLKMLCVGLAACFGFDMYVYADATLFAHVDSVAALMRGAVQLLALPLLVIAIARSPTLRFKVAVSRRVVFHTTTLLASGLYLLAVSAAGYYLRTFGGTWGQAVFAVLVTAALILLALIAVSGSMRSRLRVLISKNFFSYRYDYREEWLRFINALSNPTDERELKRHVIMALADLVESPGGLLLMRDERGFAISASANASSTEREQANLVVADDDAMVAYLTRKRWIVALDDCRAKRSSYEGLTLPTWLSHLPEAWLVIPLFYRDELTGMAVLQQPRTHIELDWEVLDLLKTASRQAAAFLGYARTAEALMEARKFEAFNKMSAFVVHDLKNLVAQLQLLSRNAQRHMDNPDFRSDMLMTIDHAADRMSKLMMQLREDTRPIDRPTRLELTPLIGKLDRLRPGRGAALELILDQPVCVMAHSDRLERVLGHLVQNALEATHENGKVTVRATQNEQFALIEVIDNGQGMTEEFVRERLFKPFQSTKSGGMGIGTYESAQYIKELGGQIDVVSQPGEGTRFRVSLPLCRDTEADTKIHG